MIRCLPRVGKKEVKQGVPTDLKGEFPKFTCCMKIATDWIRPAEDLVCSVQADLKVCNVEILLIRATAYARCTHQSALELDDIVKRALNPKRPKIPEERI